MRLILEKEEIISVLSKHFDAELDPDKVIIRTDPLEIEVCGLPLGSGGGSRVKEAPAPQVAAAPAAAPTEEGGVSPMAVIAASKALEAELERDNPKGKRRAGSYSLVPPPVSEDEV